MPFFGASEGYAQPGLLYGTGVFREIIWIGVTMNEHVPAFGNARYKKVPSLGHLS